MKTSRRGLIGRMALVAAAIATLITAGTQQAAGDITTGLIGHWKLDEVSGTTAADSNVIDTLHDGTLAGTPEPTWVAGEINNALDFSVTGGYGYVQLANNGLNMGSGSFTMAAWIKPDDVPNKIRAIFGGVPGGAGFWQANGNLAIAKKNDWESYSVAAGIVPDVWQHVAVTVDSVGSTITFYVNGVAYAEADPTQSSSDFTERTDRIGNHGNNADENFDGMIDDARIYNRALSASDVTELYNYPPTEITGSVLIVR